MLLGESQQGELRNFLEAAKSFSSFHFQSILNLWDLLWFHTSATVFHHFKSALETKLDIPHTGRTL